MGGDWTNVDPQTLDETNITHKVKNSRPGQVNVLDKTYIMGVWPEGDAELGGLIVGGMVLEVQGCGFGCCW